MLVSRDDVVARMRQALKVTEPDLDTTIGSPVRKILDVVGESVAMAYADQHLLGYQYDIDSKQGADLDDYVAQFGFTRIPARRASGVVTFERQTASGADVLVPIGTQVATQGSSPVIVATVVPARLIVGETTIDIPARAAVGGATGNVAAGTLTRRVTPVNGIMSMSNYQPFTGGADAESDAQLRLRFKRTALRGMAGTEDMFLGVALDNDAVTHANVIGASKRRREQVEIVGGTATSTVPDAKYVYPDSAIFGANIDDGSILTPGVHYNFAPTAPPSITVLDPTQAPDGVYDFEFEYLPEASRNDPEGSPATTNRVDVYVNGRQDTPATEIAVFSTSRVFSNVAGDRLDAADFVRADGTHPNAGNYFIPLSFAPISIAPDSIRVGGIDYFVGSAYFMVLDDTNTGGTSNSLSGIEWVAIANGGVTEPTNGAALEFDYSYNSVPGDVERAMRTWRLITTDVRVHAATRILLRLNLAIIYLPGYSEATVRPQIEQVLSDTLGAIGFNNVVQVSDLLAVVHGVPGVDSVRFLTSDDDTDYGIERMSEADTLLSIYSTSSGSPRRAVDVIVGDDEYPVLHSVRLVQKAENTFGAG